MEFAHICPTEYLDLFASNRPFHLTLAHLVEQDPNYAEWYRREKQQNPDTVIIMDNSAFEMYKQGRQMYPSDKLIQMGDACGADYIVMTDYPGEPAEKTIDKAEIMGPQIRDAGFGTFFVPQSRIGDVDDLMSAFDWAIGSKIVDYIGFSILAIPNAYGVEKDNKLQRYVSRYKFMTDLEYRYGFFERAYRANKKLHMLGMVDGPNEIQLLSKYIKYIDTWDSSAAIWAGLNYVPFDNSPTGLINGKLETEVDFSHELATVEQLSIAKRNMNYIDNLIMEVENGRT